MRWALLAGCFLAAACASPTGSIVPQTTAPITTDAPALLEGSWQLVGGQLLGREIRPIPNLPVTLKFEPGRLSGSAGCNYYGAVFEVVGGQLNITPGASTAMLCERDDVMDIESRYISALDEVATAANRDGRLILSGPGVELAFVSQAAFPIDDVEGKRWVVVTLISETGAVSQPKGPPSELILGGGSITGSTGCRRFDGTYTLDGSVISPNSFGMNGAECPPDMRDQDRHIVGTIGDPFTASITDGLLTVTGHFGTSLVYREAAN